MRWLILLILSLSFSFAQEISPPIVVTSITSPGAIKVASANYPELKAGDAAPLGAWLQTREGDSAWISPVPGLMVLLHSGTTMRVVRNRYAMGEARAEANVAVELNRGALTCETRMPMEPRSRLAITTPQASYVLQPGKYTVAHTLSVAPNPGRMVGGLGVVNGVARGYWVNGKSSSLSNGQFVILYGGAKDFQMVGPEDGELPEYLRLMQPGHLPVPPGATTTIDGRKVELTEKSPVNEALQSSTTDAVQYSLMTVISGDYKKNSEETGQPIPTPADK